MFRRQMCSSRVTIDIWPKYIVFSADNLLDKNSRAWTAQISWICSCITKTIYVRYMENQNPYTHNTHQKENSIIQGVCGSKRRGHMIVQPPTFPHEILYTPMLDAPSLVLTTFFSIKISPLTFTIFFHLLYEFKGLTLYHVWVSVTDF